MKYKAARIPNFRSRSQRNKLYILAAIFISLAIAVGIYMLVHLHTEHLQKASPIATKTSTTEQQTPGTSSATTSQPTTNSSLSLSISKLGIKQAKVLKLGLTHDGAVDAPTNNTDVGWYTGSIEPGRGAGAALIDGHAGAPNEKAVFSQLHELVAGDFITIDKQGTVFTYEVQKVEIASANDVDMQKMLQSIDPAKEGLNLITCNGDYNSVTREYTDRVLIYAVRSS